MELIGTYWAIVDKRWRILCDSKGELIFQNKDNANAYVRPENGEMVVPAEIYIPTEESPEKEESC